MGEKYQVLARRYRPQLFSEVVGQENILQTLKNALRRGFLAHAYLFTGSRGVGKTTLVRLFAKALNCASPTPEWEPCNTCPSCQDISMGQSLDVIEIDGASNRGIDDIRQINETVAFAPSHGKYKIYIIDEVHMLTKEAFNALLKTLEEPPQRAKFFFATTEPHKVLPTIISRCQRFDLGRLTPTQISTKLGSIAIDLGREVEPAALRLLAQYADGALRDAESLLDQILCFSSEKITEADVRNSLGLVPQDLFFELDKAFSEFRIGYAFDLVEQLFQSGKDLAHFLEQLIEHYRNITACKTFNPPELVARYSHVAVLYTQSQCLTILELLIKAEVQIDKAVSPRICLEMTLLQLLRTKNRIPIEALIRRISELESSLKEGSLSRELEPLPLELETPVNIVIPIQEAIVDVAPTSEPTPFASTSSIVDIPINPFTTTKLPTITTLPLELETPVNTVIPRQDSIVEVAPISEPTPDASPIVNIPINPFTKPSPIEQEPSPAKIYPPMQPVSAEQISMPSFDPTLLPSPFVPVQMSPPPKKPIPLQEVNLASKIKPSDPVPPVIETSANKHPSHYHTLMRFAAVELEGTFKN